MASVRVGGDPEQYMDAPSIQGGGGDGPSFFASLLDLLGIHKQVGKTTAAQPEQPPQGVNGLLSDVESFALSTPRSADQNHMMTPIDPDIAFGLPKTSR